MAEAIGLAASIVGLIAVGAKLIPWISNVATKISDAPDSVKTVMFQLNEADIIIKAIQAYIREEEPLAASHKSFISLEDLSVALTGCMLAYSGLESHVDFVRIGGKISSFDRGKWILREKEILEVIRALQNHKSSLSLMLTIIQTSSLRRAEEMMAKLSHLIERSLQDDQNLALQLKRHAATLTSSAIGVSMGCMSSHLSRPPMPQNDGSVAETTRSNSMPTQGPPLPSIQFDQNALKGSRTPGSGFETSSRAPSLNFEKDLLSSSVYKRLGFRESRSSIFTREGSERHNTWSIFSCLTWDEISNISVFNLPIFEADLYNGYHYSQPIDYDRPVSVDLTRIAALRPPSLPGLSTRQPPSGHSRNLTPGRNMILDHNLLDNSSTRVPRIRLLGTVYIEKSIQDSHLRSLVSRESPHSYRPIFYNVPSLPKDEFVGRQEILSKITMHLGSEVSPSSGQLSTITKESEMGGPLRVTTRQTPNIFVLWGSIGCGKTRIALEYVYRASLSIHTRDLQPALVYETTRDFKSEAADSSSSLPFSKTTWANPWRRYTLWINAKAKHTVRDTLIEFGRNLESESDFRGPLRHLDSRSDPSTAKLYIKVVVEYLNRCGEPSFKPKLCLGGGILQKQLILLFLPVAQNCLIVFDNVEDIETIKHYLPQNQNGNILVTTRHPELFLNVDWRENIRGEVEGRWTLKPELNSLGVWIHEEVADVDSDSEIHRYRLAPLQNGSNGTLSQRYRLLQVRGRSLV
ncbi:hypothetical protein TWF481_004912 [Arthrobotrys musiformis]|uniref:Fungal N-terminal domain-containing protein n=1 Tax=Arthrobotrys musiformis TaxID=47236 RepID=A0AAV9WLV6_9PEZI